MYLRYRNSCSSRAACLLALLALASLVSATGCSGGDRLDRIPVHGTVRLSAGPATSGSISLLPEAGRKGPAATASIRAGHFEFTKQDGPVAGPHRVIVQLGLPDKATVLADQAKRPGSSGRPAKTRWELRVDIPAGGPFQYDVTLE